MKITLDIPEEFTEDYLKDKFAVFFSRTLVEFMYSEEYKDSREEQLAAMFLSVFNKSKPL